MLKWLWKMLLLNAAPVTFTKATLWIRWFGSFVAEMAFLITFKLAPGAASGAARFMLWFSAFPLTRYTPLVALWVSEETVGRRI